MRSDGHDKNGDPVVVAHRVIARGLSAPDARRAKHEMDQDSRRGFCERFAVPGAIALA